MDTKHTLVILPGWGGSQETWRDFVALASKKYDVVCMDLPCFGTQPCPKTVWGVEHYAEFVKRKIEKLNRQHVTVLGHSFGGQVATVLVAKNPNICERLILSGAAVYRKNRYVRRAAFGFLAKLGTIIFMMPVLKKYSVQAKKLLYKGADSPDYSETDGIKRDIFRKVIRQDVSSHLPQISVPALVVWGKHDSYVPVSLGRKIAENVPNATFQLLEDGTHGLHLKTKEEFYQVVDSFISTRA